MVDAHVDDHRALAHHVARDQARAADGQEEEVRAAALRRQIGRAGMAQGHRGVAEFTGTGQQQGQGLAHDVRTAQHHGLFAAGGQVVAAQKLDDARRRARDHAGQVEGKAPHVLGMEAVHVLGRIDGQQAGGSGKLSGQGQLQQDAVHVVTAVELGDEGQQGVLRGVGGQVDAAALDAALRTVVDLAADVDLAGGVLPHQNDRQAGVDALRFQRFDLFCGLGLCGCGQCLAVNDSCWHIGSPLYVRVDFGFW